MIIFDTKMLRLDSTDLYQTKTLNKKQAQEIYIFLRIQPVTVLKELVTYF